MPKNEEEKHFKEWMSRKKTLHHVGRRPLVTEGEIWWAAVGENVGVEINGKSRRFSRPVLIFKKLGREGFMAIPLSTKIREDHPWYIQYEFHGKLCSAVLSQARVMSVSRLYSDRRIGEMSASDFKRIRQGFAQLYLES